MTYLLIYTLAAILCHLQMRRLINANDVPFFEQPTAYRRKAKRWALLLAALWPMVLLWEVLLLLGRINRRDYYE